MFLRHTSRQASRVLVAPLRSRTYAIGLPFRPPPHDERHTDLHEPAEQIYSEGVEQALGFAVKVAKYALVGAGIVTLGVASFWEGTHQYIEHVELQPRRDAASDPYGWSLELDSWTSPPGKGGTDPSLGWRGRHLLRSAWQALNWTSEADGAGVIESARLSPEDPPYDKRLVTAWRYLQNVLVIAAKESESDGTTQAGVDQPANRVLTDLLNLQAGVLERMGTRLSLARAFDMYQRVLDDKLKDGNTQEAARVAVKLGSIAERRGESDVGQRYWYDALRFTGQDELVKAISSSSTSSTISADVFPSSYDQRTVASALVALSIASARAGNAVAALHVNSAARAWFDSVLSEFLSSKDILPMSSLPDRSLHKLYLQHRASLLKMHAAENLYAVGQTASSAPTPSTSLLASLAHKIGLGASSSSPTQEAFSQSPLALLTDAYSTLESIIFALNSTPSSHPDSNAVAHPPTPSLPLSSAYASNPSLKYTATTLLRQTKRSVVESLYLCGVLLEEEAEQANGQRDAKLVEAMEKYERALAWAGSEVPSGKLLGGKKERIVPGVEVKEMGEEAIEGEWKAIWRRYVQVREKVLKAEKDV